MMKTFQIGLTFTDRKTGPGYGRSLRVEATSMPVAIGKATREFWRGLNRKQRFDALTSLKIEAREAQPLQQAPAEVYRMLDRAISSDSRKALNRIGRIGNLKIGGSDETL